MAVQSYACEYLCVYAQHSLLMPGHQQTTTWSWARTGVPREGTGMEREREEMGLLLCFTAGWLWAGSSSRPEASLDCFLSHMYPPSSCLHIPRVHWHFLAWLLIANESTLCGYVSVCLSVSQYFPHSKLKVWPSFKQICRETPTFTAIKFLHVP